MRNCFTCLPSAVLLSRFLCFLLVVSLPQGCNRSKNPNSQATESQEIQSVPLRHATNNRVENVSLFERLAADQTNIDLFHRFPKDAPFSMMTDQCSGSGVCIGDIDGDQLPDLFFTNYDQGNRLYRNLGNFKFQDITTQAGLDSKGSWCGGASFVDVDNDGDLDLFVSVFKGSNLLYINQGDSTFVEQAAKRGLDFSGASVMMSFADYDRDGDLDGYLVTHRLNVGDRYHMPSSTQQAIDRGIINVPRSGQRPVVSPEYQELFQLTDRGEGRIELIIAGQQDILYRNDGKGNFQKVNGAAGIRGFGIGLASTWWDYNDDGWIDLYVSNDYKGADQLYHNNGDGTFSNVIRTALPHVPWFSMGNATADVNNDGRIDLFASDMSGTNHYRQKLAMGDMGKNQWFLKVSNPQQYMRNALFLNTGTSRTMEAAQLAGLANTDWTWSPIFADLDSDGWIDLFVTNGMSRDFMDSDLAAKIKSKQSDAWATLPVLKERNLAFRNQSNLKFEESGQAWGLDDVQASYGAATADLDNDGDLDLVCTNFDAPVFLYRNRGTDNNIVSIRLEGLTNRWGIGAKVECVTRLGTQTRFVSSNQGFMSASEPQVHFGLGEQSKISKLVVTWPEGDRQSFSDLAVNQTYTIRQQTSNNAGTARTGSKQMENSEANKPWFRQDSDWKLAHRETEFDDFALQPLLPAKLSQQGPGLAAADVNGDGIADIFITGAAGQPSQLLDGKTKQPISANVFFADQAKEQLAAVFFDCDQDNDIDLFVVSGSVECGSSLELLQDRLYLNDGRGTFSIADPNRLPKLQESGSCVAAADFDKDGDIDLFVGGRVRPGRYPTSPASRLLRNDNGSFVNDEKALQEFASSLTRITSACWVDTNNDGWLDLVATQQWGPVRHFVNRNGALHESTQTSGLGEYLGWWNGVATADVDQDGDVDLVATNQGLNTKYHATPERPSLLYYGDFEGNGVYRIVEASYENDTLYPDRGRSCSTAAIPSLANRFYSFRDFAAAKLDEVYSPDRLSNAIKLSSNEFRSGLFINDGNGKFDFQPLPRIAQIAPAYGVVLQDLNQDGIADIYLVHNSFSPQLETGRMDGGLSLLLTGKGDGRFEPIEPANSGLVVPGDAKSVISVDVNQDGKLDLVIGVNNDDAKVFVNRQATN